MGVPIEGTASLPWEKISAPVDYIDKLIPEAVSAIGSIMASDGSIMAMISAKNREKKGRELRGGTDMKCLEMLMQETFASRLDDVYRVLSGFSTEDITLAMTGRDVAADAADFRLAKHIQDIARTAQYLIRQLETPSTNGR